MFMKLDSLLNTSSWLRR